MYTASVCVDDKEAGERVLGDVELGEGRGDGGGYGELGEEEK